MKRIAYNLVIVSVVLFSCDKKKYPDTVKKEAVFYTVMELNGEPVSISAGFDDYYNYSTYAQDTNHLYQFFSSFSKATCSSCPSSLKIQINDYKRQGQNVPVKPDSSFKQGLYSFLSGEIPEGLAVKLTSTYNKGTPGYWWDFGDGQYSTEENPVHIYSAPGKYKITLRTTGKDFCSSTISNTHAIGIPNALRTSISTESSSDRLFLFRHHTSGGAGNYSYFWNFADGNFSTNPDPFNSYNITGSYGISLRVIDQNNDTVITHYNLLTGNDKSSCAANFDVMPLKTTGVFSKIVITWTDASGTEYTSNNSAQPASSFFEVLSIEDYKNNENNQATKKIKVRFECMLYSSSSSLFVKNAEAVIAVAYPK